MSEAPAAPPLVIGVGNPWRRDDGVGPWVARELALRGGRACVHEGDGAALIERFDGEAAVVLIDAIRSGARPGTVRRFEAERDELPARLFQGSTHLFGLAQAVGTARALGRLPGRVAVVGVEGACFGAGEGLSEPVARAASSLVAELSRA